MPKEKLAKKICQTCDMEFDPARETSKFCSRSCQVTGKNKASKKQPTFVDLICEWCKKTFQVVDSPRILKRITCSGSCRSHFVNSRVDKEAFGAAISKTRREGFESGRIEKPLKEKNGMYGKTHSPEVIAQMGVDRAGEGNAMFGRKHSEESRDSMSDTRMARIVAGVYDPGKWAKKGEIFARKADRLIPYRSTWELRVIEMLEQNDDVESFKFEPFRIPYVRNEGGRDNLRHYVPDFLVTRRDGKKQLIEIKPKCWLEAEMNLAKFAAAREYCSKNGIEFIVWTQKELGLQGEREI